MNRTPALRVDHLGPARPRLVDPARDVRAENLAASCNTDLDPTNPQWLLAVATLRELEGSALPPERRQRILVMAKRLGVRSFDANVIIAMTQDRARRGQGIDGLDRLFQAPHQIGAPPPGDTHTVRFALRIVVAAALGLMAGLAAIQWITG